MKHRYRKVRDGEGAIASTRGRVRSRIHFRDRHAERSAAESKNPAEIPMGFASGWKAWPRPESFRGCVAASTSLGMTAKLTA